MGFGVSVFLIAIGAVLAFAVNVQAPGIDVGAIGVILMVVGSLGLVLSALWWYDIVPWGTRYGSRTYVRSEEIHDHDGHAHDVRPRVRPVRRVVERRETYP